MSEEDADLGLYVNSYLVCLPGAVDRITLNVVANRDFVVRLFILAITRFNEAGQCLRYVRLQASAQ